MLRIDPTPTNAHYWFWIASWSLTITGVGYLMVRGRAAEAAKLMLRREWVVIAGGVLLVLLEVYLWSAGPLTFGD